MIDMFQNIYGTGKTSNFTAPYNEVILPNAANTPSGVSAIFVINLPFSLSKNLGDGEIKANLDQVCSSPSLSFPLSPSLFHSLSLSYSQSLAQVQII